VLAATICVYAVFTGAAALSQNVYQLGLFRFLAGIGIGGEWALAGTYVAEAWPEDRRKMGAGYLQTGYYAGFFLASALNYTVAANYGWRAMFWCGLTPVLVAALVLWKVKEPARWQQTAHKDKSSQLAAIFAPAYRRKTIVNTLLLSAAICGLWAGTVYAPTALIALARLSHATPAQAVRISSTGMGVLSIGTILGCLLIPVVAERIGRRFTYYHPGLFNGIFSLALAGGMLAPGTLGLFADSYGIRVVAALPLIGTLMVVALVLMIWLESKVTGR